MRPESCKAKGRRLQQLVVADLLEMFPHLTPDDVRSTSMGAGGEDVQLSSQARRSIPFSIECKNQEKLNVWNAMDQAQANAPEGSTPIVIMKKNNSKPQVVISWEAFKDIIASPPAQSCTPRDILVNMAVQLQSIATNMDDSADKNMDI